MEGIKELYQLLYSAIITPYNLLENAKLDNYSYVKFYDSDAGLIAEMECKDNIGESKKFYYCFNQDDELEKVFLGEKDEPRQLIFDRRLEADYQKAVLLSQSLSEAKKLNEVG